METYSVKVNEPVILIVDAAHMLRRSIYQPNLREFSNSVGMPTGGVYGFLQSLKSSVNSFNASSVIICHEGGHSERRKQVYEHYKERDHSAEEEVDTFGYTDYEFYCHQLSWVKTVLECLGVPQLQVSGKEGDDIIFQTTRLLKGQKIIISEDSDFFSLISDKVSVYRPIKKVYVDKSNFEDITGLPTPTHYLYSKVMSGDGSDNIPAIAKGVGWKTIKEVLCRISDPSELSPNRIIKEASSIKGSRYNKIVDAGASIINRNLDLIDISRETFNIFELESLMTTLSTDRYPDISKVTKLFNALEFNNNTIGNLINRLTLLSTYDLSPMIDKDYIKRVMLGETSTLQG